MAAPDWPNLYRVTATMRTRVGANDTERKSFYLLAVDYEDAFKVFYKEMPLWLGDRHMILDHVSAIQIERIPESFGFTDSAHEKLKALK